MGAEISCGTHPCVEVNGMKERQHPQPEDTRAPRPLDPSQGGARPPHRPLAEDVEDQLDEALDESFPASDPPSITPPKR